MKRFGFCVAVVAGCVLATAAAAQENGPPLTSLPQGSGCFHVAIANQGSQPNTAIRWNSCTGQSWLLLRAPMTDKNGKATGSMWAWFPVPISDAPANSPLN